MKGVIARTGSNCLAAHLTTLQPPPPPGLLYHQSFEMVVGLLKAIQNIAAVLMPPTRTMPSQWKGEVCKTLVEFQYMICPPPTQLT